MQLCVWIGVGVVGGPAVPLHGAAHHAGRTHLEVSGLRGARQVDRAAVRSVEAGHPDVWAEQQVILLFAQVEDGSTEQAAGGERTAHRDLHPGPAAPAVAGVTVDMLSHPGGPRTMTLMSLVTRKQISESYKLL